MKTILRYLIPLATMAVGVTTADAANNETRRVEQRLVFTGDAGEDAMREPREPVTYLGVAVVPVDATLAAQLQLPEGQGLVVNFVESDSPADKVGLQQHDVLTRLDDQILIEPRQLSVLVRNHGEGDAVAITYLRAGKERRATAALEKHVPSAAPAFQWIGGGAPNMYFRSERFGPLPDVDGHRILPAPMKNFTLPAPEGVDVMRRPGEKGERVMIFRPEAGFVFSDDAGSLAVRVDQNERVLTAKDPAGKVVFEGPINTPEQRAKMSDDLRERLEKFEGLDVMEASPPPLPSGQTGAVPGGRSGRAGAVL